MSYNHLKIEKKWQKYWQETELYKSHEDKEKPKYYVLDMFPYPSGTGLHVGHPKGYIASDIISRLKMMQGFSVLHPMGFDAFGLPAENFAIKNKLNPKIATEKNIEIYKKQLEILGFSYDWSREIRTIDPEYYKWTQWIFLQMYHKGLAYESHEPINWCPDCKTGLANEDLEDGHCERCDSLVEKKPMRQWVLKITDYAERLLNDLEVLNDWEEAIIEMQRNWIGKSLGAEIKFEIKDQEKSISVFTTRIDTIYGCTYVVISPENILVQELKEKIKNWPAVEAYIKNCQHKSDLERSKENQEKTGLKLEGILAINPFSKEEVPIYIADFILSSYGTGAVMAVPAHDERDFQFAQKYNLKIKYVIRPEDKIETDSLVYTEDGVLKDSGKYSKLNSKEARKKMILWLKNNNLGQVKINYKLNDWVFSRQRYWGEPIPIIHCENCGVVPVPEKDLPVKLPDVKNYQPTGTGESPLAKINSWVNVSCPKCSNPAKRETNTMPQWAGSCWYYLRYMDSKNDQVLVDKEKEKYWSPVDLYIGGAEHATRHLIYARFWHKFLYDIGIVNQIEPFKKLRSVGLIMGEDGRKMSKRWGNVVNPDEMVKKYGADALRVYTMFMGPFEQSNLWNSRSLNGAYKFLEKIFHIFINNQDLNEKLDIKIKKQVHKTIKKIASDTNNFKFNTAISSLMIFINSLNDYLKKHSAWPINKEEKKKFIQILAPYAPHISEELWQLIGENESIFLSTWPKYKEELLVDDEIEIGVQVNGKLRAKIMVSDLDDENTVWQIVQEEENVRKYIDNKEVVKKIYVAKKIFNIVVK
jgi:leucyl-tRNA synthetase